MNVVGHEAVRKNLEVVCVRGVHKLQPHIVHEAVVGEARAVRKRAQRKEITASPDIRTIRETSWSHVTDRADHAPMWEVQGAALRGAGRGVPPRQLSRA